LPGEQARRLNKESEFMTALTGYMLLFVVMGVFFVFIHLLAGRFIRPVKPDPEKLTIYECGEPTIGSAWVQFDLRFYVVALLFVIFDVEVAFFFPWAVVFGKANMLASERLTHEQRVEVTKELVKASPSESPEISPQSAKGLAWLAFWDIMVFFGVLLVGFAYLWRRGDLDWVRSIAAERAGPGAEPELPVGDQEAVVAGAGRETILT
jgi:NADH-quinone oxidoreductase subunit A